MCLQCTDFIQIQGTQMRKTEVYQIRLDTQEKQQAFEVFKQLGLTPAQAIRMFFKQVVFTQSIPFSIEHKFPLHFSPKPLKKELDDENHHDIFKELDTLLSTKKETL